MRKRGRKERKRNKGGGAGGETREGEGRGERRTSGDNFVHTRLSRKLCPKIMFVLHDNGFD